jgi:hypothetical protein
MITHGINIRYQNLRSPLHSKQQTSNNARCVETTFYILAFYVVQAPAEIPDNFAKQF